MKTSTPRRASKKINSPLRLHLNEPSPHSGTRATYPNLQPLQQTIATLHGVAPANVLIAAGADRVIDAIMRGLRRESGTGPIVMLTPDFPRYREHAMNEGHVPVEVRIRPDFEFPAGDLAAAITRETRAVILSTVANPTAIEIPAGFIEKMSAHFPSVAFIVDEVYSPFTDHDFSSLAVKRRNVFSLRSFSKIGYPGIRVGYAISASKLLEEARTFVFPFEVSGDSIENAIKAVISPGKILRNVARQIEARRHLAGELAARGIGSRQGGNFVLAEFGSGAKKLATTLADDGCFIMHPRHPSLLKWARISAPNLEAVDDFLARLDRITSPPFVEQSGLLRFREDSVSANELATFAFVTRLYGEFVEVDHFVVGFPSTEEMVPFLAALEGVGGAIAEGPGIFPTELCPEEFSDFDPGLAFHFASIAMPNGGIVVTAAPRSAGDQLARFYAQRGPGAIHHIALKVDDLAAAAVHWRGHGFQPGALVGSELQQQFLKNHQGQIVELIQRPYGGAATFTCGNIRALRESEK